MGMSSEPSILASSNSQDSRTSSNKGRSPASSLLFRARGVMFPWPGVSMSLELVVRDHTARRGCVELLDDGQMRGMLHVLPKTGSVLKAGKDSVGISSGAPRGV